MSDYTDLIARLRADAEEMWGGYCPDFNEGLGCDECSLHHRVDEAAAALEALQAERDAIDALPNEQWAPGGRGYHADWAYIYADGWTDAMKAVNRILHPGEPT